nr:hypothetical protein [Chloroflexota bacterium]
MAMWDMMKHLNTFVDDSDPDTTFAQGVDEPNHMMHVYFRPDNQVLMLSSAKAPPFDPMLE